MKSSRESKVGLQKRFDPPCDSPPDACMGVWHLPQPRLCPLLADAGWQRYKYAVQVLIGEQRGEGCR
jgi:hypothetical protein